MLYQLDHILGSLSKVQLLRAVLPLTTPFTGREAQRLGRIRSTGGAQKALEELSDLNLITRVQAGSAHVYEVNTTHHLYSALLQLFRDEEKLIGDVVSEITGSLEEAGLHSQLVSVVVFGSVARGRTHSRSDVDLLVVVQRKSSVAKVSQAIGSHTRRLRNRYGVALSPYVIPRDELLARYRAGDPLLQDIMASGRTLVGEPVSELFGAA
ncbi:MAG: nucleotidyltransferase domain-containing protein [Gemmatimonadota bacterium]